MNTNTMNNDLTMNNAVTMRPNAGGSLGRIDQYELIRELGGGGFGCVYLAKDTVAGIEVAVKGLPPLVRLNKEELENVRKNFALVSRLYHPNIAAALHFQKVQSAVYNDEDVKEKLRVFKDDPLVVMQYARGVTLSQWRKQFPEGKVPLDKAIEITRQIASALDYAHEEKILHRDIKPANVMIETGVDGKITARVLDFGLAAEIRSSMSRVSQSVADTSGTRPYMAPEQWGGRKQGKETDLYSLAVLFYELVSGEVPFASVFDTGDPILMKNVVENDPPEIPSDLPKPVRLALAKALAKKREDRFASCSEFVDALVGRMSGGRASSLGGRASPRAYILTAVATLGLAIGGVWYWQSESSAPNGNTAREYARPPVDAQSESDRKAAEEAARIAAEKAKAEAEERARKAEEARLAAEKKAERNAELEVFRLYSKVKSAHELIDQESSEIKEFFATEIRAFENNRISGDEAKEKSRYVITTNFYTQALSSATALKISVTNYRKAKKFLPEIERAKERADEVKASETLPSGYKTAQVAHNAALDALKQKRFDECMKKGKEAETLFISLRVDVIDAVLDIAEGHKDNERWDKCKQEAEKVLSWDANNAKAIELKNEALNHLVPSLKVIATIDGEEVGGAKLNDGQKDHVLPVTWKLERGENYGPYKIVYERGGKSYEGRLDAISADWHGLKLQRVTLKEEAQDKVQLWEGGPYWAAKNIGADKPEDSGYYFWWGDTVGYKREGDKWVAAKGYNTNFSFSGDNTPTYNKSISYLESEGWIEKKNGTYVLTSKHDAAQAHLGGAWRMPTKDEFDDLLSKCDWTWTTRNGKNGYVVRGRGNYASKSIFLPAAGDGNGASLGNSGSTGYYWSSVPDSDGYNAYELRFYSGNRRTGNNDRCYGRSVRPVQGFTK